MPKSIAIVAVLALIASSLPQDPPFKSTNIHTIPAAGIEWTPTLDGKRIYFVRDSHLVIFDRVSGRETVIKKMPANELSVSRQNDRLAFTRRTEDGRGFNAWTIALNPATGLTAGEPVRLSLTNVDLAPEFSPDGKTVTLTKHRSAIALAPVNGGPERVILKTTGSVSPVRWAPDGKSLYVGLTYDRETATERNSIVRVPTDGSTLEIVARSAERSAYPGLTPDGKFLVYWRAGWDSVIVQTVEGTRVAAFLPQVDQDVMEKWTDGFRGIVAFSYQPRALTLRLTSPERTLALPDSFQNPFVAVRWAPDGKRVAVFGRPPVRIVVMNAEGTVLRRIPVHVSLPNGGMHWSPDGQRLMYAGPGEAIHIVDVAAGTESDLQTGGASRPIWRSDSRAVLYSKVASEIGADSLTSVTIREIELNGRERVLRTIDAPCRPAVCDIKIVSDSLAVMWRGNEYRVIPLRHPGEPRLTYTRLGAGQPVPTFSNNGQWMAVRVAVQGEQLPRRIDVMRIDGSQRRTVELSMTTLAGPENPIVSHDGRELLVLGAVNGGFELHRVDASGRSTTVTTLRTQDRTAIEPSGISPDGRSILFQTALPPYTQIREIDMSALLQRWRRSR